MLRPFALLLLLLAAPAALAKVEIVRVWPEWRDTASFKRISEHFTGRESTGRETVLRTQPDSRDGLYWAARLRSDAAGEVVFRLEVIRPGSPDPVRHELRGSLPTGSRVFWLGLTGADWLDQRARPTAWRLTVLAPDGAVLASTQSNLWSALPPAP